MKKDKIAIIGLGYVGLPLARLFATKYSVVGFDINTNRISELMSGVDLTLEVDNETLQPVLVDENSDSNGLFCTNQLDKIKDCNYYIITVPTPVDKNNRPILTPLVRASETVGAVLKKGDIVIGFNSSGVHSNGFSLINKLIENGMLSLKENFNNSDLGKALIKPTKLYVDIFKLLKDKITIHGAAHITGGGLTENLPRVIPDKCTIHIDEKILKFPKIFKLIQDKAFLSKQEMLKTFNCGIGMVLIIGKKDIDKCNQIFSKTAYKPKIIGYVDYNKDKQGIVYD